jgi:hypothetical protein
MKSPGVSPEAELILAPLVAQLAAELIRSSGGELADAIADSRGGGISLDYFDLGLAHFRGEDRRELVFEALIVLQSKGDGDGPGDAIEVGVHGVASREGERWSVTDFEVDSITTTARTERLPA